MDGTYDPKLVALSLVVAAFASYAALELAGRVTSRHGSSYWAWLLAGAFAMGTGIWSMHFIGMLAFSLPIAMAYDPWINALSWVIAMAVSGVALWVVRRPSLTTWNVSVGATLMGAGICSMHYTGMAAMQMSPPIRYDPPLFVASVIIAIVASLIALWIAFQLRKKRSAMAILAKLGSAVVMGLAITGMHYTGMAAAQFAPGSVCLAAGGESGLHASTLAVIIGLATFSILTITLVISAFDAHYPAQAARLADSLQAANEQLRNVALYDTLTGLPNRFLLEDRLGQAVNRANRERKTFALMFVDLDKFKPVNDTYGHGVGDELLKAVAQRLTGCVRRADTVARSGGDEFVIVLSEIGKAKDAALIGKKILETLARPVYVDRYELDISCSIGISVYPDDGNDINTLLVNADVAMYHAKKGGRNNYRFFVPAMRTEPRPAQ
jgi:diguanylate cyclase (GGDEF)-like protein